MNKATDILYKAFTYIHPALLFQQASANAIDYRAKVRLIQRHWLSKCTARKTMLLKFTSEHVQQLLKIYPHFKIFISQW